MLNRWIAWIQVCWCGISAAPLASAESGLIPVPSAWELVEVSPVDVFDSNPRGISNHREFYTEDGRICMLAPSETMAESTCWVKVSLTREERIVEQPDGTRHRAQILEVTADRLVLKFAAGSTFEFRRIGEEAVQSPAKLQSLQVVHVPSGTQRRTQDVIYLEPPSDDSSRKLLGTWESIAFSNVQFGDLPPYGFPNVKWVFAEDRVAQIAPDATQVQPDEWVTYSHTGNVLRIPGEAMRCDYRFNEWGDLVLTSSSTQVTLRQLSDDPEVIPAIPAKVAVLFPAAE